MPLEEHLALAKRVSAALRSGAETLSVELTGDEVDDCLMRWGIVLGILAADVLDGVALLLADGNPRAANMLARPMADYDIRLRYYHVQWLPCRRALERLPEKRPYIIGQSAALRDWNNSRSKYARLLSQYDESTWTDKGRAAIEAALQAAEPNEETRFSDMVKYLAEHEARNRGVPPMLQHRLDWRYQHQRPAWAMQSSYLHGDQVIVSDVIEFSEDGEPTGNIFLRPPYDPNVVILFTALDHGTELLRSLGMVRPTGWIMEEWSLHNAAAKMFLERDRG